MSAPRFMSPQHVDAMNEILEDSTPVQDACSGLARCYTLAYELQAGPDGHPVYWSMVFDPDRGVVMGLDRLESADMVIRGSWVEAVRAARAQRRGEEHDPGFEVVGDPAFFTTVSEAYERAQRVASLEVTFPSRS